MLLGLDQPTWVRQAGREACERIVVHDGWPRGYLADDMGFPITDVYRAADQVQAIVDTIA